MFTFPIIQDKLFFEMTPLIPTREFSGDSGSFMPYALVRMAEISGNGVEIDLSAFVTLPEISGDEDFVSSDDLMAVSINLNPENCDSVLTFICNASDRCILLKNGEFLEEFVCDRRSGEDERGVYWSVTLPLSTAFMKQHFDIDSLDETDYVMCNAYKAKMNAPHRHFGAVAPFAKAYDFSSPENLVPFKVIKM